MNGQGIPASPVQLEGLGVRYGRHRVLEGVSLGVAPGQVYALLGRNGAGKSSLVRCLLGWQQPSEGRAALFGEEAWTRRTALMARVGVVQESPAAPPKMSVGEILAFCASLYPRWDGAAVEARVARADISLKEAAGTLSKGQRAQLALALALGHGPELLVLDDPTLGLDAVARRAFFETLVLELADRGVAVLLTTHDLAGVEGVADRVGILAAGHLKLDEDLEALKGRFRRLRWTGQGPSEEALASLKVLRQDHGTFGGEALVGGFDPGTWARVPGSDAWEVEPVALEDAFIALVDGSKEVRA